MYESSSFGSGPTTPYPGYMPVFMACCSLRGVLELLESRARGTKLRALLHICSGIFLVYRGTVLAAQVARPGTNKSDVVLFYSLLNDIS
jgi:hypothetical protein